MKLHRLARTVAAPALWLLTLTAAAQHPPTQGTLDAFAPDMKPLGQCPLKHTDVAVDISGFIARVTLKQEFTNPFSMPIEAVYTFPMSERAAVDSMTMTIGDRTIKGLIKKRDEARQIYEAAKHAGQTASLLDQERPNIFTQSVANIMPGNHIVITISYVEYLVYKDGEYTYAFPMVVGPRYIPGGECPPEPIPLTSQNRIELGKKAGPDSTDQVPDAGRVNPPITPEGTRAGHDISLAVTLDAGVPLQEIESEQHDATVERPAPHKALVRLTNKNEIPNRDFVLKYTVAGNAIEDALLTHTSAKGGFFSLILQPPARIAPRQITPKEMIFVIDCSGSMSGFPIEKAKATMKLAIEQMNPADTFNLVTFAGGLGYCFESTVPNTPENRRTALEYLANLQGGGGTEMMPAIHAALGGQTDSERLRIVCFMTDGFIGNDMAIIDAVQKNVERARVFAFGIGNSVNRFLIEGMGRAGRGASEIVTLESDGEAAAARFAERIQSPVLTNISVDFGNLPVERILPEGIPDLFASQPVVITGRYKGAVKGTVVLRGQTATGPFERAVSVELPENEPAHDVLASLWARTAVEDLMYQDWLGIQQQRPDESIKEQITSLGLEFGLLTQFTSFVAVEETVVNKDGKPTRVEVPVEMPDGVSYEGIFGTESSAKLSRAAAGQQLQSLGYAGAPAAAATPVPQLLVTGDGVRPMRVEGLARGQRLVEQEVGRESAADKDEASKGTVDQAAPALPVEVRAKIAPSLAGLAGKVVNGAYRDSQVEVKRGRVELFIVLADDSEANLKKLRDLGVTIKSHTRAGKRVLAVVAVEDIERIAKLGFVARIEPAKF